MQFLCCCYTLKGGANQNIHDSWKGRVAVGKIGDIYTRVCVCVGGEREREGHDAWNICGYKTIYREAIAVQGKGEASGMCNVAECDWREARACLMQLQVHVDMTIDMNHFLTWRWLLGAFTALCRPFFSPFNYGRENITLYMNVHQFFKIITNFEILNIFSLKVWSDQNSSVRDLALALRKSLYNFGWNLQIKWREMWCFWWTNLIQNWEILIFWRRRIVWVKIKNWSTCFITQFMKFISFLLIVYWNVVVFSTSFHLKSHGRLQHVSLYIWKFKWENMMKVL